jgi:transcriptional regulator with XRE-family HTH domain
VSKEFAQSVGARLRAVRQQQGLSLQGVEQRSRGRWKAVVIGSYERGDRAVSIGRLAELAEFYGIPVGELLPDGSVAQKTPPPRRLMIDLEKLATLPRETAAPLVRFAASIQARRGDYNGRVLSLRRDDLHTIALLYESSPATTLEQLAAWGVLTVDAPVPTPRQGSGGGESSPNSVSNPASTSTPASSSTPQPSSTSQSSQNQQSAPNVPR